MSRRTDRTVGRGGLQGTGLCSHPWSQPGTEKKTSGGSLALMINLKTEYFDSCQLPRRRHGTLWNTRPYGGVHDVVSVIVHLCLLLLPCGRRGVRASAGGNLPLFLCSVKKNIFPNFTGTLPAWLPLQVFLPWGSWTSHWAWHGWELPEPLGSSCAALCVYLLFCWGGSQSVGFSKFRSHTFVAKIQICKLKLFLAFYAFFIMAWHLHFLHYSPFLNGYKVWLRYKITIVPWLDFY